MAASEGGGAHSVGQLLDEIVALVANACEAPKRPPPTIPPAGAILRRGTRGREEYGGQASARRAY